MSKDFIPHQDAAFYKWAQTFIVYVGTYQQRFSIPSEPLSVVTNLYLAFETAFIAYQDANHGKIDVLKKNETRDALIKGLRPFIKSYLMFNPAVTDADKESMGLPLYDNTRTPIPPPSTIPELEIETPMIRLVSVHFKDFGSKRRGKPKGVHGIELRWGMSDTAPLVVE
ncbi:MAG: hypothetical protein LBD85_02045, partial [Oscillospiraceae bacterium]|nr:hypothetical protein [Oscillospiraceae bacterium]